MYSTLFLGSKTEGKRRTKKKNVTNLMNGLTCNCWSSASLMIAIAHPKKTDGCYVKNRMDLFCCIEFYFRLLFFYICAFYFFVGMWHTTSFLGYQKVVSSS